MAIRTKRINQTTPVSPIDVEGLIPDTKDTIEQISNDALDALDVTTEVSRTANDVITKIVPTATGGDKAAPSMDQDAVEDALTEMLGSDAGGAAAEVIKAIEGFASGVIDIINDIIRMIPCSISIDITVAIWSLAGYFSFAGFCNPMADIHKAVSVTGGLIDKRPSKGALKNIGNLSPGSIKIVNGDAVEGPAIPDINNFDPSLYTEEQTKYLIGNGKTTTTHFGSYADFFTADDQFQPKRVPYLAGLKEDYTYTVGTIRAIPTNIPDELIPATNKAVGVGLTVAMETKPNNAVAAIIYLANPSWIIQNMPSLPRVLIKNIKRSKPGLKTVITRELLGHLDSIYPVWYTKVTNTPNEPYVGLRDYYEASDIYMPNARCLSNPITLNGVQKLKILSGARHAKYRKHVYPIINVSV